MANPSGGGGKERGLQSYKARSVATGRPLIGAMSAINLSQAIFTVCHHPGRSREIWHYFTFPHYRFSFCFSIITSEAGRAKRTQASESVRSTFASCLQHFALWPWASSLRPAVSSLQEDCGYRTCLNTHTCTAPCLTTAELKSEILGFTNSPF